MAQAIMADIASGTDKQVMDKTQFYTSFVNSIVAILSQKLVIQDHYNA